MSYHENMAKGKKPEIEMPPLPQEAIVEQVEKSDEKAKELHPQLQQALPFEAQEVEQEEAVVEKIEQPQEEIKASKENQSNIRAIREKAARVEKAERERDELIRKLQEMEAAKAAQTQSQPKQEEQEITIDPEGLVEGKHLSKYDKKIKQLEEKIKGYEEQTTLSATETRLKNQYPDFDKVVSRENIEELRATYPEIAETLNSSSNLYTKAVSAYTLIKKLGISNVDSYEQDKERAIKNISKPRPLTSISPQQGDSPLSKANAFANGLTDELKTQLRKEMYAAMKNN